MYQCAWTLHILHILPINPSERLTVMITLWYNLDVYMVAPVKTHQCKMFL